MAEPAGWKSKAASAAAVAMHQRWQQWVDQLVVRPTTQAQGASATPPLVPCSV